MAPVKIMVIDDDLDTLRLLDLMLMHQGYQLVTATSGEQAFDLIEQEKPKLVLLDLMMPGMDGIEVARRLRTSPTTKDILIIIFSAMGTMAEKLKGFEAGVDDYLVKPIQPRELVARLRAVLQHSSVKTSPPAPVKGTQGKLIGILAAQEGGATSRLAVNLGFALLHRSQKSIIVGDFRRGNSTISFEIDAPDSRGLGRLLELKPHMITSQRLENELYSHSSGVRFLQSSAQEADICLNTARDQFEKIASLLPGLADFVVLDLDSSLPPAIRNILEHCECILVQLEPHPQSLKNVHLLLEHLRQKTSAVTIVDTLVLNSTQEQAALANSEFVESLVLETSTVLASSQELAFQAQNLTIPMILTLPGTASAQQFESLADWLISKLDVK